MKKVFVLLLVILVFTLKAFSQTKDTFQQGPSCFMIAHVAVKANTKNVSDIYCIGDKIKVVLWDNRLIKGTLVNLSRDSMLTVDGTDIDFNFIRSITKTKRGTGTAIAGSLLTLAGVATLATFQVDISEDADNSQFLIGLGLIAIGAVVLTSNVKFNVKSGDHMVIKD